MSGFGGFGIGHNKLFGFGDQQGRFVRTERTDGDFFP